MTLDGKIAVVTGASSGIGAEIVRQIAAEGAKVFAMARRVERLEELAQSGSRIVPVVVDLRDEAAIRRAFAEVGRHGPTDILVNNAGLGHATGLADGDSELWREMLEVNVLGLCICTREAIAQMRAANVDGHIVHISSMAAHRVPPGSGMYSATKFAVRSLTEGLRSELRAMGSGIRVSSLSPGYVETEFAAKYHKSDAAAAELYSRFPMLKPEDIAASVLHVLNAPPHVQIHDLLMRPTEQGN